MSYFTISYRSLISSCYTVLLPIPSHLSVIWFVDIRYIFSSRFVINYIHRSLSEQLLFILNELFKERCIRTYLRSVTILFINKIKKFQLLCNSLKNVNSHLLVRKNLKESLSEICCSLIK